MKSMKFLVAILMLGVGGSLQAQITKEQLKERQEIKKMSKAELNEKATKAARKEAKKLTKEGWKPAPGALPLEKQLDRSYLMQQEFDEDGFPKYIIGEAMSVGENYDAAKMQAAELAKLDLAGKIQTEVAALIENNVANEQLPAEEAASLTQSLMAAKSLITQSIGRTIPLVEVYREKTNKNKEVRVYTGYNAKMAKAAAKKAVRDELAKKSEDLQKKLDEAIGW